MSLPSVTVVLGPAGGGWQQPAGAHAWWMGQARDEIQQAQVDVQDGALRTHRALMLEGAGPGVAAHLRDAEIALHAAQRHLEAARRQAVQ